MCKITVFERTLCACTLALIAAASCFAERKSAFALQTGKEIIIASGGLLLEGGGFLVEKYNPADSYSGTILDISTVNVFDRWAAHSYNAVLDTCADFGIAASIGIPVLAMGLPWFAEKNNSVLFTDTVMYAEAMLAAAGARTMGKAVIHRARPFMYFDGIPQSYLDSGDWDNSWPSGHATLSFCAATYGSYVFCEEYPESAWKIPVTAAAFTVAATTSILRVLSGNHFPTDIISGAVIGSACGFLVPFVHHVQKNKENKAVTGNTEVSVLPGGFVCKIDL